MTGPLALGATTPDGRAFRVDLFVWREAFGSPHGPPSTTRRTVLMWLSVYADGDGASMFPTNLTLAIQCGHDNETVRDHLAIAVAEGWVRRWWRDPTEIKAGGPYAYEATVPIHLRARLAGISSWKRDPKAKATHMKDRRRRIRRRPVPDGAGDHSYQPVASVNGAGTEPKQTPSGIARHPVQDSTTSSSTSSVTSTKISSDTRNDLQGIEKRLHGKRLRDASLNRPAHDDYSALMERCVRQLQREDKGFDLRRDECFQLAKASCGLKSDAEAIRIIKQLDDEGRLPSPPSPSSVLSQAQPHGEAIDSTDAAESPAVVTPAAARA